MYCRLYPSASITGKKFYNIGAGGFRHPFWTNVDMSNEHYDRLFEAGRFDIAHDLLRREPIPVPENSAELIYTSHTIEHIDDISVKFLLSDCYRMLRPGGVLRIVSPDINLIYRAWQSGDRDFFYWDNDPGQNDNPEAACLKRPLRQATLSQLFLLEFAASVAEISLEGAQERINDEQLNKLFGELPFEDALNYCSSRCPMELQKKYPALHINWFHEKKLKTLLSEAGFSIIYRSGYLQSAAPVMRQRQVFDTTNPEYSLYMEAIR
jgi:predicted SAM-dependent methyltransferase